MSKRLSDAELVAIGKRCAATRGKYGSKLDDVVRIFQIVDKDYPALVAEVTRLRKALALVLAESDNDRCNEMDSLITCVNIAEEALEAK